MYYEHISSFSFVLQASADLAMSYRKGIVFLIILNCTFTCAVVPDYLPADDGALSKAELMKQYFYLGFTYAQITLLLFCRHNIKISVRHLKRILKQQSLSRRITYTPFNRVKDIVESELLFSGECIGYRSMWHRLKKDYHLNVKRNDVLLALRTLDPDGIQLRKARRLKRRLYHVPGPNFVWHTDGYDKLKQFGLCIHAAIDGYSRRIMWLEVGSTNNNPKTIANYYLETIKTIGCAPRLLRADRGTENSVISFLQPFFRYNCADNMAGLNSFIYGKSTTNQKIESWWGSLRRQGIHWWICKLKDLRDSGRFDSLNQIHVECLRFCCSRVLQAELDRIAQSWNTHQIRQQRNSELPCGRPDVLFFVPEMFGGNQYGVKVDIDDVALCKEMYAIPKQICSREFEDLARLLKPDIVAPRNAEEAIALYNNLLSLYDRAVE